jgi:hypothetical protein
MIYNTKKVIRKYVKPFWSTVPTTKLRTPPSFYVYSYGATCLIATRITFERLGIEFFFFFWRPEEKSIYKSYTLGIFVGRTPK